LGGWSVAGITTFQSGTPFSVANGSDRNNDAIQAVSGAVDDAGSMNPQFTPRSSFTEMNASMARRIRCAESLLIYAIDRQYGKQRNSSRSEAARLRSRLVEYYAREGSGEPLIIELPRGGYTPLFRQPEARQERKTHPKLWHKGALAPSPWY
jgi:hypothetical protein